MTKANLQTIYTELGYETNKWIEMPKITRINLTTNGSLFNECGRAKAEYYFDTTNELLLKRLISQNKIIQFSGIVDINEIVSIELLSPYSESVFNGNSLLRR